MTEVRYLPRARGDVLGAVEFYESRAAGLGAEFLSTLEHTISSIIAVPHAGSPHEGGTRRVVLGRFPSSLVRVSSDVRRLFDAGYVTVTPQYEVEVSHRVRDHFDDGENYLRMHGGLADSIQKRARATLRLDG